MDNTATRVIKNTGWLYAKMGITMFISLWTTRLILNGLGASDFGIFNIVGGAIAMLGFLNAAMASATMRFMSYAEGEGNEEKEKTIFNVSIILHIGIAIIVALILIVAGFIFFNGVLNIPSGRENAAYVVYGSLVVSTLLTIINVPYDAVMNAHENMKYYAIIGILESLFKLSVAFACIYAMTDKLILYGILMACIPFVTLSIMKVYCHKKYDECVIAPSQYCNKATFQEMTTFAGWNLLSSTIAMVSAYGQGIILNSFFGTLLNAAQGIAGQLNGQLQTVSSNMMKALNPIFAKSAGANDKELLFNATWAGAKFSTALYLVIAIPCFFYTEFILTIWLKNVPEWTVIFMRLQLIRTAIEFMFGPLTSVINANGNIKWYCILSSISNLMQLPMIYLLFKLGYPPYMMYIIGIIFGNIIVYSIAFIANKLICNMPIMTYFHRVCLPILVCTMVCIFIYYIINCSLPFSSILGLVYMIILAVSFTIAFLSIGCHTAERKQIKAIVFNLYSKIHTTNDISCDTSI